jgi:hypothetical protein
MNDSTQSKTETAVRPRGHTGKADRYTYGVTRDYDAVYITRRKHAEPSATHEPVLTLFMDGDLGDIEAQPIFDDESVERMTSSLSDAVAISEMMLQWPVPGGRCRTIAARDWADAERCQLSLGRHGHRSSSTVARASNDQVAPSTSSVTSSSPSGPIGTAARGRPRLPAIAES